MYILILRVVSNEKGSTPCERSEQERALKRILKNINGNHHIKGLYINSFILIEL